MPKDNLADDSMVTPDLDAQVAEWRRRF